MPLDTLDTLRDWVLTDQRDLELQDFITAGSAYLAFVG